MKLEEIANISIGILVNREEREDGEYIYNLFNLKKYEEKKGTDTIRVDKDLSEKMTKEGDILFRLVWPNKVIYIDKEQKHLLVPSQLCIIRPNPKLVNPIFLKWYLESTLGQEKIMCELKGSSIQKISVSDLKKIEIPIIDIEKQEVIKDLIQIWSDEKKVLREIIDTKEMLYTNIIKDLIEGGE